MSKQDGYASRTAADLERKYNFGQTFAEVYGLAADARKAAEEAQNAFDSLDQEAIFNLLTNYGQAQGIYRDDDGNVYVNASYIQSGTLADNVVPASITRKNELPALFEQFGLDKGYLEETGVTNIVKGVVTTDYVNALGISVNAAQIKGVLVIGEQLPSDLAVKSNIPTKTSQLTNDSDFAATSDIPTKVSQLTNDSGFATTSQIPSAISQLRDDIGLVAESNMTTIVGGIVTTDFVNALGISVDAARVTGKLTADQIDVSDIMIDSANISGRLTFTQLPTTVARQDVMAGYVEDYVDGLGLVDENTVTTITQNAITTATIRANQIEGGTISGCFLDTNLDGLGVSIRDDEICFNAHDTYLTMGNGYFAIEAVSRDIWLIGSDVRVYYSGSDGNYWEFKSYGLAKYNSDGEQVARIDAVSV